MKNIRDRLDKLTAHFAPPSERIIAVYHGMDGVPTSAMLSTGRLMPWCEMSEALRAYDGPCKSYVGIDPDLV